MGKGFLQEERRGWNFYIITLVFVKNASVAEAFIALLKIGMKKITSKFFCIAIRTERVH